MPAALPQIVTGMRVALGVAWLVVVAAEMIAVNSGLGYLIIDSRNAGNRYDLVVAGMVIIGVIGFLLDTLCAGSSASTRYAGATDMTLRSLNPGSTCAGISKTVRTGRRPGARRH